MSILDKLLEQLMYNRLYTYLSVNNILYTYQFGFRHNDSTASALIEVLDTSKFR